MLKSLENQSIPRHIKDFVGPEELKHRDFLQGAVWERIPAFHGVSSEEFQDIKFQNKHTVRKVEKLEELTKGLVETKFIDEVKSGMEGDSNEFEYFSVYPQSYHWKDPGMIR